MANVLKTFQVVAQVESAPPPLLKVSQIVGQVEYAVPPPLLKVSQVVAQVEYTPNPDLDVEDLKGHISFLRFDKGRSLSAAWHAEEWDRLRFGWPIDDAADCLEVWTFGDTLVGLSSTAYTLTWQGGGSPGYIDGYPTTAAPLTITFTPRNHWLMGYEVGLQETVKVERALSGKARTYRLPRTKESFLLPFEGLEPAFKTALRSAYLAGDLVNFYLDADNPMTCQAIIVSPPIFTEEDAKGWWSGELELQEA